MSDNENDFIQDGENGEAKKPTDFDFGENGEEVVSKDLAQQEVLKWLDYKKVRPEKRKSYKSALKSLVAMITEGMLVMNAETHVFTMTLLFPVGNKQEVLSLDFSPRITAEKRKLNVAGTEGEGTYHGIIAALTGKPKNIIGAMDTEDFSAAQNIALFFV